MILYVAGLQSSHPQTWEHASNALSGITKHVYPLSWSPTPHIYFFTTDNLPWVDEFIQLFPYDASNRCSCKVSTLSTYWSVAAPVLSRSSHRSGLPLGKPSSTWTNWSKIVQPRGLTIPITPRQLLQQHSVGVDQACKQQTITQCCTTGAADFSSFVDVHPLSCWTCKGFL